MNKNIMCDPIRKHLHKLVALQSEKYPSWTAEVNAERFGAGFKF